MKAVSKFKDKDAIIVFTSIVSKNHQIIINTLENHNKEKGRKPKKLIICALGKVHNVITCNPWILHLKGIDLGEIITFLSKEINENTDE